MAETRRAHWMDTARALAILLVVLNHAVEYAWPVNAVSFPQMAGAAAFARFSVFTLGRLGIPLFLFLSGALNLRRDIGDDGGVLRFYRRKLLPLLLCCELWIVVYNLFACLRAGTAFSLKPVLKKMLFLEQSDLQHMWYMAMLLGVYLAAPFLAALVKRFSLRSLCVPLLVVFCASFLLPLVNLTRAALGGGALATVLDLSFLGAHYGLYFLLGYFLGEKALLRRAPAWLLAAGAALSFGLTVGFQLWCWGRGYAYSVWYSFPGLLACAVCLFALLRRLPRAVPGAETVSRLSLAVFFLHRPLQLLLFDRLPPGQPVLNTLLLWAAGTLLSLGLAALVRRCRPLARILFLIKD